MGVVAIRPIPKGTLVFTPDDDRTVRVNRADVLKLAPEFQTLYGKFCVLEAEVYVCPVSFNKLTPAWYLNDSDKPNVQAEGNLRFVATRDIAVGEEVTSLRRLR